MGKMMGTELVNQKRKNSESCGIEAQSLQHNIVGRDGGRVHRLTMDAQVDALTFVTAYPPIIWFKVTVKGDVAILKAEVCCVP